MSDDWTRQQEVITDALQRHAGMDLEAAAVLRRANEDCRTWYAWCPRCKTKLVGSLGELSVPCPVCEQLGQI